MDYMMDRKDLIYMLLLFGTHLVFFGCNNRTIIDSDCCKWMIKGNRGCPEVHIEKSMLPSGIMDVSMEEDYWLFLVIKNECNFAEMTDGKPERGNLTIKGFEIELDFGSYNGSLSNNERKYFIPYAGFIEQKGMRIVELKTIPYNIVSKLNIPNGIKLTTFVKIQAIIKNSTEGSECGKFIYNVNLCKRCLVDLRTPPCPSKSDPTIAKNICGLPQDSPVTCCLTKNQVVSCYETKR